MLPVTWLLLMALCGWASGQIVGSKAFGRVADGLLGITGAMFVSFLLEALRIDTNAVNLLLFSVWGAAALPAALRLMLKVTVRSGSPPPSFSESPEKPATPSESPSD